MCSQDAKFIFQYGSVLILVLGISKDNFGVIIDFFGKSFFKHPTNEEKNAGGFHSDSMIFYGKGRLLFFVLTRSIIKTSALKLGYVKVKVNKKLLKISRKLSCRIHNC